jgi:hypothetical protein
MHTYDSSNPSMLHCGFHTNMSLRMGCESSTAAFTMLIDEVMDAERSPSPPLNPPPSTHLPDLDWRLIPNVRPQVSNMARSTISGVWGLEMREVQRYRSNLSSKRDKRECKV